MLSEVRVLDLGPRLCGEMGSHAPVKGKSGDRNPVEPPTNCPGTGYSRSLLDQPAEFESQTDNHAGVAEFGRRAGFRFRCLMTWGFEALHPYHRGMLKGKLVSVARKLYARSVTAILHQAAEYKAVE